MPDEEILNKAIELGTTYFKSEDYRKARSLFEKALKLVDSYSKDEIKKLRGEIYHVDELPDELYKRVKCERIITHPKHVKILDNLSACWEKQNILDNALKLSHKMVKLEPFNIKTYIRKGRILMKLTKYRDAYHNFKEGLTRIQYASQKYELIPSRKLMKYCEQQKNIVRDMFLNKSKSLDLAGTNEKKRKLIDPILEQVQLKKQKESDAEEYFNIKEIDFIEKLPIELTLKILRKIRPRQLAELMLVCRKWREVILQAPALFDEFLFQNITLRQMIKFNAFIMKLSKINFYISGSNILHFKTLKISPKSPSEEFKITKILLESSSEIIRCNRLIMAIPNTTTSHIAKMIPKSNEFTKSIRELSLMCTLRADKNYELDILESFEYLTRLEIMFHNSLVPLSSSDEEVTGVGTQNAHWTRTLKYFSVICDTRKVPTFPFKNILQNKNFPSLKKLCISGVTMSLQADQFDWLTNTPALNELWLENNNNAKLSHFFSTIRDIHIWDDLKRLTFRENRNYDKVSLEANNRSYCYLSNLRPLETLDLMGGSITGLGLTRLFSYFMDCKITKLNLGDCMNIQFTLLPPSHAMETALQPSFLLSSLPNLNNLQLPKMATLDDDAITLFSKFAHLMSSMDILDISFNPSVTGVSVYSFLKNLNTYREKALGLLNIDNCNNISHITVGTILAQGFVNKVSCVYEREHWHNFGSNSFRYMG